MAMIFWFHTAMEQPGSTRHVHGGGTSLLFPFEVMFLTHFSLLFNLSIFSALNFRAPYSLPQRKQRINRLGKKK